MHICLILDSKGLETPSPGRFGMSIYPLNTFAAALAAICQEAPLTEKWLVAPSLRIGYQWLDRIALAGRPVFNVRVFTLTGLALDLAAAAMEKRALPTHLSPSQWSSSAVFSRN